MKLLDDILDGLKFRPLRRWIARLRQFPQSHTNHVSSSHHYGGPGHRAQWESSTKVTTTWLDDYIMGRPGRGKKIRYSKPKNICESCAKRGWHWETYEANAGVMKRKATCLGDGNYYGDDQSFRSDLDDMGGAPRNNPRDIKRRYYR